MGRGLNNDIVTLAVLGIGGYLIYTKTDWFQQFFAAVKDIMGDIKGGGSDKPLLNLGGGGSSGGNLGATGCGQTIYPPTGKTWAGKDTGPQGQKISYASGGGGASRRINHEGVSSGALECTIYFTFNGKNCHDGDKENMTIKAWGPKHSDNNCCWCLFGVQQNGDAYFGGEGPHPNTDKNQQKLASLGSLKGKKIGQKLVIWPGSGGAHQEAYVDLGSGWKLLGSRESPCGANKKENSPVSNQQIEFRIDCTDVSIDCSHVAEITPGKTSSAYTSAGQYSTSLFTNNIPIPLGYYRVRN